MAEMFLATMARGPMNLGRWTAPSAELRASEGGCPDMSGEEGGCPHIHMSYF
jgi:hypothetical protein